MQLTFFIRTKIMKFLNFFSSKPKSTVLESLSKIQSARLTQKIISEDFSECDAMINSPNDQVRELLITGAAQSSKAHEMALNWTKKAPYAPNAYLVMGAATLFEAIKIKEDKSNNSSSTSKDKTFQRKLSEAMAFFQNAANLDKSLVEPYAWMIHTSTVMGKPLDQIKPLFSEANSRNPMHWASHYKYFLATLGKNSGNHKEMFEFVRFCKRMAPNGHILNTLIPCAYNQLIIAELKRKKDPSKAIGNSEAAAKEICSALYAWTNSEPKTLKEKLFEINGGFSIFAINNFATALYYSGAKNEAKELIVSLNGEIDQLPWGEIFMTEKERKNPGFIYDKIRKDLSV